MSPKGMTTPLVLLSTLLAGGSAAATEQQYENKSLSLAVIAGANLRIRESFKPTFNGAAMAEGKQDDGKSLMLGLEAFHNLLNSPLSFGLLVDHYDAKADVAATRTLTLWNFIAGAKYHLDFMPATRWFVLGGIGYGLVSNDTQSYVDTTANTTTTSPGSYSGLVWTLRTGIDHCLDENFSLGLQLAYTVNGGSYDGAVTQTSSGGSLGALKVDGTIYATSVGVRFGYHF